MKILAKPGIEIGDLNPYTRLLYDEVRALGHEVDEFTFLRAFIKRYDILHFHWPEYFVGNASPIEAYLGSALILFVAIWARIRGSKNVWTVHNVGTHAQRRPRLEKLFWRAFCEFVDGYISLTAAGQGDAQQQHANLAEIPGFVIPHGHYRAAYSKNVSKGIARDWLSVPRHGNVICFFGTLTAYKGISELIRTFKETDDPHLVLLIAGESDGSKAVANYASEARTDVRIRLHEGFVPPRQVQFYLLAADLIALPFRQIWNSGTALLALSFNRPILVPQRSAFAELRDRVGGDWVRMYRGGLTASELKAAVDWSCEKTRQTCVDLEQFEWSEIAKQTVSAYERILVTSTAAVSRAVSDSPQRAPAESKPVHRG